MTPQERMERLRAFGLSEYAGRAYLALLELGTTEAREVSRLARIPLAKVYAILEQLQEKGLVVILAETPKKYVPVSFGDYVDRLRQAREEEARELSSQRDLLAALFPIVGTTEMDDRGGVSTLRGRRNFVEKARLLIQGAKAEVLVMASEGAAQRAGLLTVLESARERGLRTRLIIPTRHLDEVRATALGAVSEVRVRPDAEGQARNVSFIVVDATTAMLIHHVPDDASAYTGKDVAVVLDAPALVQALKGLLETTWQAAPKPSSEPGA